MTDRLSTGIEEIDRETDGGFPAGSIVAIDAPADSQIEVMLETIASERRTLYITTTRSEDRVRQALSARDFDVGKIKIKHVGADIEQIKRLVKAPAEPGNIVIDPWDLIERNITITDLVDLFETFTSAIQQSGCIIYLHCIQQNTLSETRRYTFNLADGVMEIEQIMEEELQTRVWLPKLRGDAALREMTKLKLTDEVVVDSSRDIA